LSSPGYSAHFWYLSDNIWTQGYFSDKYVKVFGRYVEFFLGYLYGDLPELSRTSSSVLPMSGPEDLNSHAHEETPTTKTFFFNPYQFAAHYGRILHSDVRFVQNPEAVRRSAALFFGQE
jgi:hypothetical protein